MKSTGKGFLLVAAAAMLLMPVAAMAALGPHDVVSLSGGGGGPMRGVSQYGGDSGHTRLDRRGYLADNGLGRPGNHRTLLDLSWGRVRGGRP